MVTRRAGRSRARRWPPGIVVELLTGRDYFHDSTAGELELLAEAWSDPAVRAEVYRVHSERGSRPHRTAPWAERAFGADQQ